MSTSNNSRKRKHPNPTKKPTSTHQDPDPALFIQAYEATIIRGPHAKAAARSLEVVQYESDKDPPSENQKKGRTIGEALIRWGGSRPTTVAAFPSDADEDCLIRDGVDSPVPLLPEEPAVWVDRYDVRLLLDVLPPPSSSSSSAPPPGPAAPESPTGSCWSDLPSDSEDMFFFSPDEADDFRREKKRKVMERTREERLKARMLEDGVDEDAVHHAEEEDVWGGSDEEPDQTQKELMSRTAQQLLSSSNPAQLEMRVLANYGADKRFAFLRGRWKRSWVLAKHRARVELERKEEEKKRGVGLGLVAGYGSDEESNDDEKESREGDGEGKQLEVKGEDTAVVTPLGSEEAVREARRLKAKEWAEKRRAMKEAEDKS